MSLLNITKIIKQTYNQEINSGLIPPNTKSFFPPNKFTINPLNKIRLLYSKTDMKYFKNIINS